MRDGLLAGARCDVRTWGRGRLMGCGLGVVGCVRDNMRELRVASSVRTLNIKHVKYETKYRNNAHVEIAGVRSLGVSKKKRYCRHYCATCTVR